MAVTTTTKPVSTQIIRVSLDRDKDADLMLEVQYQNGWKLITVYSYKDQVSGALGNAFVFEKNG